MKLEKKIPDYEIVYVVKRNLMLLRDEKPKGCFDLMGDHFRIGEIEIYVFEDCDGHFQIDTIVLPGGDKINQECLNRIFYDPLPEVFLNTSGCSNHEELWAKMYNLPHTLEKRVAIAELSIERFDREIRCNTNHHSSNTIDLERLLKAHNELTDCHKRLTKAFFAMFLFILTCFVCGIVYFISPTI